MRSALSIAGWRLAAAITVLTTCSAVALAQDVQAVDAAERNDLAAVRTALGKKADVNLPDAYGNTALAWAVHHDNTELIDLLLAAGASVQTPNRYGVTPLSVACLNGSSATVAKLLKAGADPNTTQSEGETVLMTASRSGNLPTVKLLLERGADVNAKEKWRGQTALMWAAAEGHADVVRTLLASGADRTARSAAGPGGSRRPRNATAVDGPRGFTPILFAVRGGHLDVSRTLLDAGDVVDDKTPQGNTLLHLAIMNAHYELAGELVKRGANPNAISSERLTPLHHVVHTRRPGWQTLPPPVPTGRLDSLELMKLLIAKGADVNMRLGPVVGRVVLEDDEQIPPPQQGATALWLAATGPDVEAMRVLLAAGADPFISTENHVTTLVAAAGIEYRQGYRQKMEAEVLEAVKLLVEKGIDVNEPDYSGNTPLHGAAMRGVNGVVTFLVEKGADLDAWNRDGKRPVELAEDASDARSQPETAALLRRLMAPKTSAVR